MYVHVCIYYIHVCVDLHVHVSCSHLERRKLVNKEKKRMERIKVALEREAEEKGESCIVSKYVTLPIKSFFFITVNEEYEKTSEYL